MTKELQDKLDAASIVVADGKGGFYAMLHKSDVENIAKLITPDNSEALEALKDLVQLKEWKDRFGKDEHYLQHQPIAWKNAVMVIKNAQSK